ncbi:DUF5103 domain-containing protein [Prevotella melaninogenica]|uniref:Type 9 secretion system plug protein N-terminal domain-containing protein n=1 Tax=Prevotella melaninogenica DNF00666 TaxID=1401073 RepID=A0A096C0Z5_9BACT|nr:DUF5103 domain-containing protein [Prevotella melaninogenica]KGF48677.1 hypothetical protein HMPREF0661_06615 [Prevotella melaninogenica DNF00666]
MRRLGFIFIYCLAYLFPLSTSAQRHEINEENIRSLQVVANQKWMDLPIMILNGGKISIDFDDLTHTYRRLTYRLEHCEADWKPSVGLFESDIVDGFIAGNTIDDIKESTLTNTLYTHYHLDIPNDKCQPKLSGNYRLYVYDDDSSSDYPLLTACFMLTEPAESSMGVRLNITTQTDQSINREQQQAEMLIDYGPYTVSNPQQQIKTVVLQNRNWLDARWNSKPQYVMPNGLRWSHNQDYIFWAGNEYRKFEILSTNVASMGVDKIGWDGKNFHAYLYPTTPFLNYLYDEDADGAFLIRNSDNVEINTTSDYMLTHFQLNVPSPYPYRIFLNGDWIYDRLLPAYEMTYNSAGGYYEAVVPLKLGYYNYQFLAVDEQGCLSSFRVDNSHYQTENSYQTLIYFRPPGGRTDKLVGYANVRFIKR